MTSILLHLLLANPLALGERWVVTGAGATLSETPSLRLNGGILWYPFPDDAWGGLGEVVASVSLLPTMGAQDYGAMELAVGYGRVSDGFWVSYFAGFTGAIEVARSPERVLLWSASIRAGIGTWAMRACGFVTSQEAVVEQTYYALALEKLWAF